jgi:hypothetical protein
MVENGPMPQLQELAVNHGVLTYLGQGVPPGQVPVEPPSPDVDRFHLGAHPDVVAWLWDRLGAALPARGERLVAGGAALIDPNSGVILAAALGTSYAIRLSGVALAAARADGYASAHHFTTVDRTLDLAATFGEGWLFGRFDDREPAWLAESAGAANL